MNAQTEMHHSNQHSAEQLCDMLRYSTLQLELMFLLEDAVSPSLLQCAEGHKQGGPPER